MSDNITISGRFEDRFPWRCLIIPAVVSAGMFLIPVIQGPDTFLRLTSFPDTKGYTYIAWNLVKEGCVPPNSHRSLGYPLFLAGCFSAGGETYGYHLVIAIQLLLNLLLLPLTWSFLASLSNQLSPKIRLIAAFCVWLGGLGLAWRLLGDFLAGFCFDLFLWGFCFRRTRGWIVLSAASLFYAILTRPTFNFLFIILPILPFLVRRFALPLSWRQFAIYFLCSLSGLGVNTMQERYSLEVKNGLFSLKELTVILWYAESTRGDSTTDEDFIPALNEFHKILADRTGKPFESLTRRQRDEESWKIMQELLISHPKLIACKFLKRLIKIPFSPVDTPAYWFICVLGDKSHLNADVPTAVRGIIFLLCLPLWLLAYFPGKQMRQSFAAYLIFYGLMLAYIVGLSALAADGGGDRYRFPMLMMICSTAALQAGFLAGKFRIKTLLHRGNGT